MRIDYVLPILDILYENLIEIPLNLKTVVDEYIEKHFNNDKLHIAICDRRFIEAPQHNWSVDKAYYIKALHEYNNNYKLNDNTVIHVYSDDVTWLSQWLKEHINNTYNLNIDIIYHNGKRNNNDDVIHFYSMMNCRHFILSGSTYHYWPCLMNSFKYNFNDTFVCYPTIASCDWYKHIVHSSWIPIKN
jgi:hypothetical protein